MPLHKKLQSRSGAGDQRHNDASMVRSLQGQKDTFEMEFVRDGIWEGS